jgi:hypothetical protein
MSVWIAVCHSGSAAFLLWEARDVCRRVPQSEQLFIAGKGIGSSNSRDHPRSPMTPAFLVELDMRTSLLE